MLRNLRNLLYYRTDDLAGSTDPAPGTGEEPLEESPEAPPAAEPTPTETTEGEPPGPIPYSRFKEVNDTRRELQDQLEPYQDLAEVGYGAEELRRLAAWEMEYTEDPAGVWLRHADSIVGLPDSVKAAIAAELEASANSEGSKPKEGNADQPPSEPEESDEANPPEWFQPYAEDFQQRREAESQKVLSETMGLMEKAWEEMDEKDGIKTPETSRLKHLKLSSLEPAENAFEVLTRARESYLEEREAHLGHQADIIRNTDKGPRSVPGGGSGSATPSTPHKPKSLREATQLAAAAAEAGRLTR